MARRERTKINLGMAAATMPYDPGTGGAAVTGAIAAARAKLYSASTPSGIELQQHERGMGAALLE